MPIFNNNKFFPQNFLLTSCADATLDEQIERICSEARRISPDSFNGEQLFFKFNLRYCPPYEQEHFRELKRLQEVARSYTRFKYEYKGYIVINITEWMLHLEEELFSSIVMAFLSDKSDCWKYIFISETSNISEKDIQVLNRFFKVKRLDSSQVLIFEPYQHFLEDIKTKFDILLSYNAVSMLRRFIPEKAMRKKETILALERDFDNYFGTSSSVSKEKLLDYFIDPDGVSYDLISEKNISDIQSIIGGGQRV